MATLGDIVINMRMDHSAFSAGSNRVRSDLSGVGSFAGVATGALNRVQAALGGVVAIAAGLATKFGFGIAADAETAQVAFETLLGSADNAKKMMAELTQFAAETPFEMPELRDAAKSLIAFGTEQKKVIPDLRRLGDVSALSGKNLGELSTLYGKARINQRLFGDDVTRFAEAGIPIFEELRERFGVTGAELKKLVEQGAATFDVLEAALIRATSAGGRFAGGMAKQSETLSGLKSTLLDNIRLLAGGIGAELVEAFDLKGKTKSLIEFVGAIAKPLADGVRWLREFAAAHPALVRVAAGFVGITLAARATVLVVTGLKALVLAMSFNPWIAGLTLAAALFVELVGTGDSFGAKMVNVFERVGSGFSKMRDNWERFQAFLAGVDESGLQEHRQAQVVEGPDRSEFDKQLAAAIQTKAGFDAIVLGMRAGQQDIGLVVRALLTVAPAVPVEQLQTLAVEFVKGKQSADDFAVAVARLAAETKAAGDIAGLGTVELTGAEKVGTTADQAAAAVQAIEMRIVELNNAFNGGALASDQYTRAIAAQRAAYDKATGGAQAYIVELQRELSLVGATSEARKVAELEASGATAGDIRTVAALQEQIAAKTRLVELAKEQNTIDEKAREQIEALKRDLAVSSAKIAVTAEWVQPLVVPVIEPPTVKSPVIEPPTGQSLIDPPRAVPVIEPPAGPKPVTDAQRELAASGGAPENAADPTLAAHVGRLQRELAIRNQILESQRQLAEQLHGVENVRLADLFGVDVSQLAEARKLIDVDEFDLASRLGLDLQDAEKLLQIVQNQDAEQKASKGGKTDEDKTKLAGGASAALAGSGEAFSRVMAAMRRDTDPVLKEAQKQTKAAHGVIAAVQGVQHAVESAGGVLIA